MSAGVVCGAADDRLEFIELNIEVNCVVMFVLVNFARASTDSDALMCLVSLIDA